MKATIDSAGRIVVPKALRRAARLEPGTELEFRLVGSHIELEPTAASVRLERRGGLTVAVPVEPKETVTQDETDAVLHSIRSGRARG